MKIKKSSSIPAKLLSKDIAAALSKKDEGENPKVDLGKLATELAERKIKAQDEENA